MSEGEVLEGEILSAIRRIVRAIELHSCALERSHGITGPQLVTLRAVGGLGPVKVGTLARAVSLSQPTVTGILARLDRAGLVRRERGPADRRSVVSTITPQGAAVLRDPPSLLQDRFRRELARLEEWERTQMLATLQRIASMMQAEDLPADPVLATEPLAADDEPADARGRSG